MDIFEDHELLRRFEDEWQDSKEWQRTVFTAEFTHRLAIAMHAHRAGITIIIGNEPIGSGVLVCGAKGHGVLTAGHVCTRIKEMMRQPNFLLRCLPQGVPGQDEPGNPVTLFPRLLQLRRASEVYPSGGGGVPDYGCMVIPDVDVGSMAAWGTFVNLTKEGPSRRHCDYRLGHNSWVVTGFLQERSGDGSVYHQHFFGSPEAVYQRSGRRYLYVKAKCADQQYPKSLGGMSGSGVWEIPVTAKEDQDPNEGELGHPMLRGIVFWQEKVEDPRELLGFYAHDLESIADDVLKLLDEEPR